MNFTAVVVDGLRQAIGPTAAVYALAAIGLNVHFGYAGLLNFGQVGFMLVGAYGVAVGVSVWGLPLLGGVAVGLGAAVLLALLLGIPTLRLRADYLAITTIAASEILRLVFRSDAARPVTNSVFGLQQFAGDFYAFNPLPSGSYGVGRLQFSERVLWVMIVAWALAALSCLLVWALMRSPWGRVLRSIREDEDAARSLGKNVFGYKLQALVIGGVIGSLGGVFLAISTQAVNPDTYVPVVTFFAYTVLILGGAGSVLGPVAGAVIFWFLIASLDTLLRQAIVSGVIPSTLLQAQESGPVRFIVVGVLLGLLMTFRPQGLFGNREEMLLDAR